MSEPVRRDLTADEIIDQADAKARWLDYFCALATNTFKQCGHVAEPEVRPRGGPSIIVRWRCIRCGAVASATLQHSGDGGVFPVLFIEGKPCYATKP